MSKKIPSHYFVDTFNKYYGIAQLDMVYYKVPNIPNELYSLSQTNFPVKVRRVQPL